MSDAWISNNQSTRTFPRLTAVAGAIAVACTVGAAIPAYIGMIGEGVWRLMALPAALVLLFLLLFSRTQLLLVIILFRASADVIFVQSRLSVAGYEIGMGGLINGFVILLAGLLVLERPGALPKKVIFVWGPLLLAGLWGVLLSPVKADAIRIYLSLISYFAIFISAFFVVSSEEDFRRSMRVVLCSSLIPALYALAEFGLGRLGGEGSARLFGTFTHPNIFAFYLTLVIALSFFMLKSVAFNLSHSTKWVLVGYILVLLYLLALTQTRSAWIACLFMFAAYGMLFERRYLLYLVIVLPLALLIPAVQDRLLDLTIGNNANVEYATLNSFAWRKLIWRSGIEWMEPVRYLLGYGAESFQYYSPVFFPFAGTTKPGAHNVYVQIFFETGIFGFASYLWLHARLMAWQWSLVRVDKLLTFVSIALIAGYILVSYSDNMLGYLAFNWYFWFIIGGACSLAANKATAGKIDVPAVGGRS